MLSPDGSMKVSRDSTIVQCTDGNVWPLQECLEGCIFAMHKDILGKGGALLLAHTGDALKKEFIR